MSFFGPHAAVRVRRAREARQVVDQHVRLTGEVGALEVRRRV